MALESHQKLVNSMITLSFNVNLCFLKICCLARYNLILRKLVNTISKETKNCSKNLNRMNQVQ